MADTNFRGPVNSMGSLEVDAATASVYPLDGPSMSYQGNALPDPRSAPFAKDSQRAGQQPAFAQIVDVWACDNIPQARTTTQIAAAVTAALPSTVPLVSIGVAGVASSCSIAVGVPIIPLGTSVATVAAMALDFGFTTGTTVANASTITVVDSTLFRAGGWVVVGNVGNAAATRSLLTQVQTLVSSTVITVLPAPATGIANVPIGQANLFNSSDLPLGTPFGPTTPAATAHSFGGSFSAGLARVANPRETLARTVTINAAAPLTATAIVQGWDVWGAPMTEIIVAAAATSTSGKKAFKYISNITLGTTAISASFGLGDTFGLPFRADEWEQTTISWLGAAAVNNNGFSQAVFSPANGTSGDTRGTVQVSTAIVTGVLATAVSGVATNGTSRLAIVQHVGVWNTIFATPLNTAPMFGVTQNIATS